MARTPPKPKPTPKSAPVETQQASTQPPSETGGGSGDQDAGMSRQDQGGDDQGDAN